MNRLKILALAPALLAALLGAPEARAFTSGGWEGKANSDETGRFSDCTMTADYQNGVTLGFIISRDFTWGLVLADDKWALKAGTSEPVTLDIDGNPQVRSVAKIIDPKGILVPLENADAVVNALRNGKQLIVTTKAGSFSFRLRGTNDAIAALAGCVADNLEAEAASGGQTIAARDTRPSDQPSSNRLFTEQQAVSFASTLLTAAGIGKYEIIDAAKNPMPNFDVVWTYPNGMFGAIAAYKGMDAVDIDEAANVVMADDIKNCQGDFRSGKKIAQDEDGISIKRVFTSCSAGGNTVEIHYTLMKTGSGHLYQLAHLNLGDATGDISDADGPFLKPNVLDAIK